MLNPPPALQTHYTVEVQEAAVRFYELIKDELTSDERQKFENRFVKPVAGFDPSDELSSYKLTPRELLTKVWRLGRSRELEGIFKANAAANPSLPQKRVKFKIRVKAPKTECENFFDDDDDFGATDDFRIEWPGKFLKDKYGGVSI